MFMRRSRLVHRIKDLVNALVNVFTGGPPDVNVFANVFTKRYVESTYSRAIVTIN